MVEWVELGLAIFGVGQLIARMTPTKKDDRAMNFIYRWINFALSKTNEK